MLAILSIVVGCSSGGSPASPSPQHSDIGTSSEADRTVGVTAGYGSLEELVGALVNAVADKNYDLFVACVHPNMLKDMLSEYDYEADDEYWTSAESVKITNFQILFVADDTIIDPDQNPSDESDDLDYVYTTDYEEWNITFTQHKSVACSIIGYHYYGNGRYEEFQSSRAYPVFFTDGRWYTGISDGFK